MLCNKKVLGEHPNENGTKWILVRGDDSQGVCGTVESVIQILFLDREGREHLNGSLPTEAFKTLVEALIKESAAT